MKRTIFKLKKIIPIILLLYIMVFFNSCTKQIMNEYYSQKSNYVNASGIVTYISYNDDKSALY